METRKVILRPVKDEDLAIIFRWRNSDKFRNLFHYKDSKISYEEFIREFQRDAKVRQVQSVVVEKINNTPIGLIFSHSMSRDNGHCFINLYVDEAFQVRGYGVQAFALLFCYLFEHYSLHKIYFEVFEYNALSLSSLTTAGFTEEGRFREHKFHNGKRHDVLRFAAYRNSIPRFKKIVDHFSE